MSEENNDSTPEPLRFIHLRAHSAYSLSEGAMGVKKLLELTKADEMPALALTDSNNLFGALEFSTIFSGAGVQPIVGVTLALSFDSKESLAADTMGNQLATVHGEIALLAQNDVGYRNLMKLVSAAWLEVEDIEDQHIRVDQLDGLTDGLILLTGGLDGPLDRALAEGQIDKATGWCGTLAKLFPERMYIELQRQGLDTQKQVEPALLELAYGTNLPVVATNEPYFSAREDYLAHDALICIAESTYTSVEDRRKLTPDHYFKTQSEMAELFADLPEALENTIEIAKRCAFKTPLVDPILPQFGTGDDKGDAQPVDAETLLEIEAEEMRKQSREGLRFRLDTIELAEGYTEQDYYDRLDFELSIIIQMKFPGYFLIVSDFIKWAKLQGIPVGPGRGSGAGSVVAWSLSITDLDPIRFGLLFERFLNPERVSMPDFDIDFCQSRREEVIAYVQDKYGNDRVAQIITFGKLQARAVTRDVGRVLQMPYGQVDRLSKLIPSNPAKPISLVQALEEEDKLREERDNDEAVEELLKIAVKLEGLYRHASTHAAGVVIGDRPLTELVALYKDPRSELPATQFNMKWVEQAGLVKFDFLGLKTLTVIEKAIEFIAQKGTKVDFTGDDLANPKAFELLSRGDTVGVFQLESTGMRESLKQLKPDRFEDIIAMVSLYRPGPMENIPTYINRKFGREEPDYLHPLLKPALEETYGVIIYQEQVMQIAQILSGYSLGEADLLRRAMGKKIAEEMDRQRVRFVDGAKEKDVGAKQANFIFDLVDKFAGYGFNKSHAAAYALLSYQTAWLKANYPAEFMAAIMTLDQGNTDKLNIFYEEAKKEVKKLDLEMLPPCVNHSMAEFTPENGGIRYSLAALKNIGTQAAIDIVEEREANGLYTSLGDFANRLNTGSVNKRALEMLASSGAFDMINDNRGLVYANVDKVMETAQRSGANKKIGQDDLFGLGGGEEDKPADIQLKAGRKWGVGEQLAHEMNAVGFYISGHPLEEYESISQKLGLQQWADFEREVETAHAEEQKLKAEEEEKKEPFDKTKIILHASSKKPHVKKYTAKMAAMVLYKQVRRSKSGNKFAFAGFSDQSGQFEAVLFSDLLESSEETLVAGKAVMLRLEAEFSEEGNLKTRLISVEAMDNAASRVQSGYLVELENEKGLAQMAELTQTTGRGTIRLRLHLANMKRQVEMTLSRRVKMSPALADELRALPGVRDVSEIDNTPKIVPKNTGAE